MTGLPGILELIHQDEIWIDREGNTHRITGMEKRHARNVIRFLERAAEHIHDAQSWDIMRGPAPSGDMANDAFDSMMDQFMDADPLQWLRSAPLLQALYQHTGDLIPGQEPDEEPPWDEPGVEPASPFDRPVHRYLVDERDGVHHVVQLAPRGLSVSLLRYTEPRAARDAADYLNTLTRWEIPSPGDPTL